MNKKELFEKLSEMADLKMNELEEYVKKLSKSEANLIVGFCDVILEHCRERLMDIED